MSSDDASCSDCKMELIERKWTELLLKWINLCASPREKYYRLEAKAMTDFMMRYKDEFNTDDVRELISSEDIVGFIKNKYPLLRLKYLSEAKDYSKKLYIMSSILVYHACASAATGRVDSDISHCLDAREQEWLVKFCENLSEMEPTIYNVGNSIKEAYEFVKITYKQTTPVTLSETNKHADNMLIKPPEIEQSRPTLGFKSSVTVMPSYDTNTSLYSKLSSDFVDKDDCGDKIIVYNVNNVVNDSESQNDQVVEADSVICRNETSVVGTQNSSEIRRNCQPGCACTRCSATGPCCGDPGSSMEQCITHALRERRVHYDEAADDSKRTKFNCKACGYILFGVIAIVVTVLIIAFVLIMSLKPSVTRLKTQRTNRFAKKIKINDEPTTYWSCEKNFCQKIHQTTNSTIHFSSLNRCTLLCMGPQLWPAPTGHTKYGKKLIALTTNRMEYKFLSVPSEDVYQHLAEAFKLFLGDLMRLERLGLSRRKFSNDLSVKKLNIQLDVVTDSDSRIRLNTDESYTVQIETSSNSVVIKITSPSFCGARHGLETLNQMILLDENTGKLITLSNVLVKDAPSYKYRGLMIDTARNYVPVPDLLRTIDAMSTCKLNTFHWRITDVTSFPLYLPDYPQLFEYGAYDRTLVYTEDHIKMIVHRAYVRGIRVVIEVAAPGPVGRAWSWSPDASCTKKKDNFTCNNILCLRLKINKTVFDILQSIYAFIINLTKVEDVFHLSNGVFSLSHCSSLIDDREGFLDESLERLKIANKGVLPKLPIIWYTSGLAREFESKTWESLGVQMSDWIPNPTYLFLNRYRVIHSSRWDLACQVKKQWCTRYRTWQEMYSWISWRNIEVFTIEGGEAILWTDFVDSGNIDYHLWPRAAAVAERLWSDVALNSSASVYTYARLNTHRQRMVMRGIKAQTVWPEYCSFNPTECIKILK